MRHLTLILIAMAALLLGACEADDGAGEATETLDLGSQPAVTASAEASAAEASLGASGDPSATTSDDSDDGLAESADASASPEESTDASATPDDGTADASDAAGTADGGCEEAFADVPDLTSLSTLGDLQDALEAIDATIEACESVDDWTAAADDTLDLEDLDTDAEAFLASRCDENDDLDDTDLCEELDS